MNVIKIDISKNNDGGRFSKVYFAHGSHGSHGFFYNEIFEHESHELHEYFIAHGSHSHGFLFAALRSRFLNTNSTN